MLCLRMMITTIQKMIMKWIGIFVICHFLVQTASHEYGIEPDYERPQVFYNQQQITPLILMVDATNRLGFSILKHHTLGNANNVAFSPCGLGSVLIALFEGSDGHSSYEIYKTLDVPFDRDLVRIGFRDIHRRLRSYFYQQENVLSGLSLSKENVTIRSGYESILRFYGYDLGNEGNDAITTTTETKRREQDEPEHSTSMKTVSPAESTTISPDNLTEAPVTENLTTKIVTEPTTTEKNEAKSEVTTFQSTISSTIHVTDASTDPSTDLPTVAPTVPIRSTVPSTQPATEASSELPTTPPKLISTKLPLIQTVTVPSTIPTTIPTQLPYLSEITTPFLQTTRYPTTLTTYLPTEDSTILPTTEMTSTSRSTMYIFTFKPITTTPIPEPDITTTRRYYNLLTTIPPPIATDVSNARLLNTLTTLPTPSAIRRNTGDASNTRLLNARNSRIYRIKRDPTNYNNFIPLAQGASGYGISSNVDFYDPYFNYATPNPTDLYFPDGNPIFATKDYEQIEHHQDEIDHIFYLNPQDSIRIAFKVYNTILRFAYIQGIQASVLELPLDSENYNLLLIVPDTPIENLVNIMGSHLSPSLRDIRASLRNNWIKTMIPKFQLKGNVVLTGDLMKVRNILFQSDDIKKEHCSKMGIHDIFEPNKADFSPMTDEFGIYARHVEQSITINIRTHANNQLRRYAQQFFDPIKVPVNRPFIFAIIDNELDLAIMVGRILNPINSRIF